MTELITITEQNGQRAVNARELHEFLEVQSKFADWIKNRINEYGFIENQDFVSVSKILENGGRSKEYAISIDMAKELSMVERNEKGKLARLYFIEMEKKAKEPKAIGYGAKINALPVEQRERALIDLVKEERFELICLIRQYMKRGDMAKTAKELGYCASSVQDVMLGRQWNESIVKAMHQKAMQNKQEALFDVRGMINELNQ
ncbi:MAG: antA/AntB antirepressor family protein [Capnocytophaga felis]|nr:antA/AntB antirepressor family protein [Capnocytophaga felis]